LVEGGLVLTNPLTVVALGGNAIIPPGKRGTATEQLGNIQRTCGQVASLIEKGHRVVLTHGNGPQVGNIIIQNASTSAVPQMPLDICGSQSQGMIGYMMQRCLANELTKRGLVREVVTLVTQVVVRADDPAFQVPTKPVGLFYDEDYARLKIAAGEKWMEDAGRGWRKVVPSPDPLDVVELPAIARLVSSGAVVICAGGGGVPVVRGSEGQLSGVEAVIDKDLAGQRLATGLGARSFVILTDVGGVAVDYGKPSQRWVNSLRVSEARLLQGEHQFRAGSMEPKVEACCRFIEAGGEKAVIGSLATACEAVVGRAGTSFIKG
jgi:carbamate kinase